MKKNDPVNIEYEAKAKNLLKRFDINLRHIRRP